MYDLGKSVIFDRIRLQEERFRDNLRRLKSDYPMIDNLEGLKSKYPIIGKFEGLNQITT